MSGYDLSRIYIRYNECPPGKKLSDHFGELSAFKEFTECDDLRIKIAILSGDIDSPFVRIKDRESMVRAIFDELGINLRGKQNQLLMDNIVSYKDEKYSFAWLRYIQILHETDFTDWLLAKKDYDFYLQKANEPQKRSDDGKLEESDIAYMKRRKEAREQVKLLGQEVKEIEAKLFPDSKAAREAAIAESRRKISLYAEMYAEPYNFY